MKILKQYALFMLVAMALSFSGASLAGKVSTNARVNFENFDDYSDVAPGRESKKSYRKRVAKHLTKQIEKMATKLPEGYSLEVTFKDIDLAGEVILGQIEEQRIVKRLYFPRLNLEYILLDGDKAVKSEGVAKLKDMGFMSDIRLRSNRRESFIHEKLLLKDWFGTTFNEFLD